MIYDLDLLVKLKIPDVTAVTTKDTLQRRMGYKGVLKDLRREDYWKIKVEAKNEKEARRLGVELAEKANIFVNPNKHTYQLGVGGQRTEVISHQSSVISYQISGRREKGEDRRQRLGEDKLYPLRVLVSYLEDGTADLICDALKNRLRYGKRILEVQRGTIWTLIIKAKNKRVARQIAREITLTKDRKKGLLANPHFQKYQIYV